MLTNQENPVFNGKAEANAWVKVEVGGQTEWKQADSDGNWSITITDTGNELDEGVTRDYTITVVDSAGNTSSKTTGQYTLDENTSVSDVDLSNANDSGKDDTDNITNSESLFFNGVGEKDATIYYSLTGGDDYKVFTTVDSDGNWQADLALLESLSGNPATDYTVHFKSVDLAGNESTVDSVTFTVDRVDPTNFTNQGLDDGSNTTNANNLDDQRTSKESITLTGTIEEGVDVSITIDGVVTNAPVTVNGSTWSYLVDLSEFSASHAEFDGKEYTYTITATDTAGNQSVIKDQSFTIDTSARLDDVGLKAGSEGDTGRDSSHYGDDVTSAERPIFVGTAEKNAIVTLFIKAPGGTLVQSGVAITVSADNGDFEIQLADDLTVEGDYEYQIQVEDAAGNVTSSDGSFTYDNSVSPVEVVLDSASDTGASSSDHITKDTTPTFNVTVEPGSKVTFKLYGENNVVIFETTKVVTDGNWKLVLPEGIITPEQGGSDYRYEISATDEAGNTATDVGDLDLVVDNYLNLADVQLSNVTGSADVHNQAGGNALEITSEAQPQFSGKAEGGATVDILIKINGEFVKVGSTTLDGDQSQLNKPWVVTVGADQFTPEQGGNYEYKVVVTDIAGNPDEHIGEFVFDSATTVTADLDSSTDLGADNDDNLTNTNGDNNPIISGKAEAGSVITITVTHNGVEYDYELTLPYPTADQIDTQVDWEIDLSDGNLLKPSGTAPTFIEGEYSYVVNSTDIAGNSDSSTGSFTVDNSAPTVSGGFTTGDSTNDTGFADDDGITNNNQPTFSGEYSGINAAIAGSDESVEIYLTIDGRTFKASASNGEWEIDLSQSLQEVIGFGTNSQSVILRDNVTLTDQVDKPYIITAVDAAGNVTVLNDGKVTIDTETSIIADLAASSDLGPNNDDNKTSVIAPVIEGSDAEPGSRIYIEFDRGTVLRFPNAAGDGIELHDGKYYVIADEDGNWSITADGLISEANDTFSDIYQYKVTVTDIAGNTAVYDSNADNNNLDIKFKDPALDDSDGLKSDTENDTGLNQSDGITNNLTPDFTGQIATPDDAQFTVTVTFYKDGVVYKQFDSDTEGSVVITDNGTNLGSWTLSDVALPEGEYTYKVEASNDYGNKDSFEKTLVIDDTAPSLSIADVTLDLGSDSSMDLAVSGTDLGFGSDDKTSVTKPQFNIDLNESDAAVEFFILDENDNLIQSYSSTDNEITWNSSENRWELTSDNINLLAQGNYQYYVKATDVAGNATITDKSVFEIDTQVVVEGQLAAESDSGSSSDDGYTNNDALKFSGTVTDNDAGSRVKVTLYPGDNGQEQSLIVTVNDDGSWGVSFDSLGLTGVSDVPYKIEAWDIEGNHSEISGDDVKVVVDKVRPNTVTEVTMPATWGDNDAVNDTGDVGDWKTKENDPVISGKAEHEATVVITVHKLLLDEDGKPILDGEGKPQIDPDFDAETYTKYTTADSDEWHFQFGEGANSIMDADSTYQFTVDVYDKAGNKNEESFVQQVTNDSTINLTVQLAEEDKVDHQSSVDGSLTESDINPTDNIIRVATPTIEGTTDLDVNQISVELSNGESTVYTGLEVTKNADGTWFLDLSDAKHGISQLNDGHWTAIVKAEDTAGNQTTQNFEFEIDTTAPVEPTVELNSGVDHYDGITGLDLVSDTTPNFKGTAEEGSQIKLFIEDSKGNVFEYSAVDLVGSDGQWRMTVGNENWFGDDGKYNYYVTSTDKVGNISTSAEGEFRIDTTPPEISEITLISSGDANGLDLTDDKWLTNAVKDELTITGKIDPSEIYGGVINLYIDGKSTAAISLNIEDVLDQNSNGDFSFVLGDLSKSLTEGNHEIKIVAIDKAGNESDAFETVLEIDRSVELEAEFTSDTADPEDGWTFNPQPEFTGTSDENAVITVTIFDNDGKEVWKESTNATEQGNWTITATNPSNKDPNNPIPFPDGKYSYEISAVDHLGNATTDSDKVTGDFFVDTEAPVFNDDLQKLLVTEDGETVARNFILGEDQEIITSDRTLTFTGQSEALNLHGESIQATISIYVGSISADNLLKSDIVNISTGKYTITTDEMPYGVHDIFLVSTDKAGNETVIQEQITIRPNQLPVTVFLDDDANSSTLEDTLTNITNPKIYGEATPYSTVSVSLMVNGQKVTFTTTAEIDGTWELQFGSGDFGTYNSDSAGEFKPIDASVTDEQLATGNYYLPDGKYDIEVNVSKDGVDFKDDSYTSNSLNGLEIDTQNTLTNVQVEGSEDGLTNSQTLNISGKTDPGAEVRVILTKKGESYDSDDALDLSYTANSSGGFTVAASDLEDGVEYTYWITSVDEAGNMTGFNPEEPNKYPSGSVGQIIIDRVTPEIEGGVVADANNITPGPDDADETAHYITRDDSPTFKGTLTGDFNDAYILLNGSQKFYIAQGGEKAIAVDGGVITLVERTGETDVWDWSYTLPHQEDGTYNFDLVTNDVAGNEDSFEGVMRVKTAINFQVSLENDSGESTDFVTKDLTSVDGEEGYLTFKCLTEADNTITATLYDEEGNIVGGPLDVEVDQTNSSNISFLLPVDPNGGYLEGKYTVEFTVTDEAGNHLSTDDQKVTQEIVYDKTPPTVTIGLDGASDTGDIEVFDDAVATDNKTMEANPVITGEGEPGADIYLKVYQSVYNQTSGKYEKSGNAFIVVSTQVSDSGSWSYRPEPGQLLGDQADGTFIVAVTSQDKAGNLSGDPIEMDLSIRTSEPEIGTWKILAKTDKDNTVEQTGVDENGNPIYVVNDANDAKEIYFQGEGATAGDTIRITIHGVEYKTIVEQDGTWSITTDPMPDLEYPFMIQALDDVGHVVTENSTVIFDSGITLTADFIEEDGWYWTHNTSNPNPEVKIYTEKDNLIEITITGPDGYIHTETFYAESTAFTYVRDEGHIYADGSYEMTIKASDKAGNTADDRVVKFTVDTKLDKMPDPEISIYENGVVSFHGKSDDKYEDTDLNIYYTNDPNFTVRVDKDSLGGEGIRAFYVKIFDLDGKEIKRYGTDEIKNGDVFEIKLRDLLTHTDGVASEYKVELVYKDKAGNTPTDDAGNDIKTEFIVSVNEKTTATGTHLTTEFVVTDLDTGVTYTEDNKVHIGQSKPVISGFGAEVGAQVTIIISGNGLNPSIIETVEVTDDGTWTFNPDRTFDDGLYEIDVIIKDKWGNDTHYEEDMLIDTFAPVIAMDKVEGDIDYLTDDVLWNTDSGKLSGVLTDRDASLTIQIGDGDAIDVTVDSNGRWEFNFTDELVDGETVDVKLTATDEAGNSSDKEFELTYDSREQMPFINDELTRSTDTGESSSDGVTNEALPTFEGRAEPNSEITLEIAGDKISTQVDSYGEWKIDLSKELGESGELLTLAEGDNDYTLTESQNGEVTRNDSGTIHLDTQAPSIIPDSIGYSDTTLSGLATEDGDIVEIFDQQGNELGEATVADGSWSVGDITGGQTVDIVISDVAGNETKVDDFTI
ncbi:Ig-like domain-containing protein [Vibrio ponticus]|uniref:Ig-like domain-containing protein n=1 Tax=Vibrio ponticus TaxID=265668 RepID=UPI000F511321|nr:Ig-like domain-containing protein [Vibrio ponticus]